jgi:hypothetical protein
MATVTTRFYPEEAQFLTTAFPAFGRIAGTNYPVTSLAFDAATQENAYWKFDASYYASGNLTLNLAWYADTATSGNIVWGAAIAAITADAADTMTGDGMLVMATMSYTSVP